MRRRGGGTASDLLLVTVAKARIVHRASRITGTSPTSDTRFSSSNTADSAASLCETRTRSALPNCAIDAWTTAIIAARRALSRSNPTDERKPIEA
ncbi:hypothetical protein [Nocardia sp. NPDC005998]|uniref:hypothetical protein n=1 Tax=Nocardia sp. NPDC005998 TaxID=3156894 RepID=UPI0033B37D34